MKRIAGLAKKREPWPVRILTNAIPDILANAGRVTVSCLEWVQNPANERREIAKIDARLRDTMRTAADRVLERWWRFGSEQKAR